MKAYKLFRVRKEGSLGSLFINRRRQLPVGRWLNAEAIPTRGFALRPGWHAMARPRAPHLSMKGRRWFVVEVYQWQRIERPASQGGVWYLARRMKILHEHKKTRNPRSGREG
ncbi:MAG: hypothetical protein WCS42_08695 [Verrucomicrobiota bacterium]